MGYKEQRRLVAKYVRELKVRDPKRYKDLVRRFTDPVYDAAVRAEREEKARRQAEEERARRFRLPAVVGLPDVDLSHVKGLVAYRVWRNSLEGLVSTAAGHVWREVSFADVVPDVSNSRGLHCLKLSGLGVMSNPQYFSGFGREGVSGFVEVLPGSRVVEHFDGVLRVEAARILCVFVSAEDPVLESRVLMLREKYPVTPVYVLLPEQIAEVVLREVLRQRGVFRQEAL